MPCDTNPNLTPVQKQEQASAITRLAAMIAAGQVVVIIGQQGGISFRGWSENAGVADVCAYRRLVASNSPELRRALARAEVQQGRKVNPQAVAQGTHSHDGGRTWHPGH